MTLLPRPRRYRCGEGEGEAVGAGEAAGGVRGLADTEIEGDGLAVATGGRAAGAWPK